MVEEKKVKRTRAQIREEARAKPHPPVDMIEVEQYRSAIRQPAIQKKQLTSLGLGRIGKRKVLPSIPTVTKLVAKLSHLVRVVSK